MSTNAITGTALFDAYIEKEDNDGKNTYYKVDSLYLPNNVVDNFTNKLFYHIDRLH